MLHAACWARGPAGRLALAVTMVVMVALGAGCEGSSPIAPALTLHPIEIQPPARAAAAPEPPAADGALSLGAPLGSFRFTMYFVAVEPDRPEPDDPPTLATTVPASRGDELSGPADTLSGPPDTITLYQKGGCAPLARVGRGFGRALDMQGTGKLRDGRVVNTTGTCRCPHSPCYKQIHAAWAMGAGGRLSPFRSVAIDTRLIPLGTVLYVPELDGLRMPGKAPWGGFVHDGCVIAADRGGGIAGHELDFFVAKKPYSDELERRHHLKRITVFDGRGWCEQGGGGLRKGPARGSG